MHTYTVWVKQRLEWLAAIPCAQLRSVLPPILPNIFMVAYLFGPLAVCKDAG